MADDPVREVAALVRRQNGVVARRQALEAGWTAVDVQRQLRRRVWTPILPGVYVDHTGTPTWRQRAWAGTLHYAPAALADDSALRATLGDSWQRTAAPIRLAVHGDRHVTRLPGFRLRRLDHLEARCHWHTSPPRMRVEEAALDVALGRASDHGTIATLAQVCQTGGTTAGRLREALAARARVSRRTWLDSVLRDIEQGTCSALEHGYLDLVERAHGLPTGRRQAPADATVGTIRRDVDYGPLPALVELDGRLYHDNPEQRDRDLDRDLAAAVDTRLATVRLGWGQVFDRPCVTAARVGAFLRRHGWVGDVLTCPRCVRPDPVAA